MTTLRQCPLCQRQHEVASDGTIPTWLVTWKGLEAVAIEKKHYLSPERRQRLEQLREKYPQYARRLPEPEEEREKGLITNRESRFLHYEDAEGEYGWIKRILEERGDWEEQKDHLTIAEGERASWYDLFESPDAVWMA